MCKFNKRKYPSRPQSLRSRLLELAMRLLNVKKYFTRAFEKGEHGNGASKVPPRIFFAELKFRKTRFRGRNVYTVRPSGGKNGTHIMFFHGGGYINGFHLTHWALIRTLAKETSSTIIAPDYPLAPKSTYKEVFDMVIPMYEKLVRKVGCSKVILMGDSAGGGIALALAQKMKKAKGAQPEQIILISPWLDVTLQNRKVDAVDDSDPMLNIGGLRKIGKAYAGDKDPDFYLVSPINGPVDGLGRISIFIGTKDILSADALRFKELADAKSSPVRYFEYKDMLHDWVLYELPESRQAIDQIVSLIKEQHPEMI